MVRVATLFVLLSAFPALVLSAVGCSDSEAEHRQPAVGGGGAANTNGGIGGVASPGGATAKAGEGSANGGGGTAGAAAGGAGGDPGAPPQGGVAGAGPDDDSALTSISSSASRTCVTHASGSVWCWGGGRQAMGEAIFAASKHALQIPNVDDARQVVLGGNHACVLSATGSVACWGDNQLGQLGDGTNEPHAEPVAVKGLAGVRAIAGGGSFTCALLADGSVKCWGLGTLGSLGQGQSESSNEPVTAVGLSGAKSLSANGLNACVVTAGATVKCWGADNNGQLGTAPQTDKAPPRSSKPADVPGLTNIRALALGLSHGCALQADGGVSCWSAFNDSGALGNGTTDGEPTAAPVKNLTGAQMLFAGFEKTCATSAASKLKCWGNTSFGPVGTAPGDLVPTDVAGLGVVTDAAIGDYFACAIEEGLRVKCWGANDLGQLGNDSTDDTGTAVTVVGLPPAP